MNLISFFHEKKTIILIGIPFIILVVITIALMVFSGRQPPAQVQEEPKITLAPTKFVAPIEPSGLHSNPPVEYSAASSEKMIRKLKNRAPLNYPDQVAKHQLLASVGKKSAVLYAAPEFRIQYINTPDAFMVQILTQAVATAKEGARGWFLSKGFTRYVMCDMPVVFYLDRDIAEQLRGTSLIFSPLMDGC